jgi:hypothetical protein
MESSDKNREAPRFENSQPNIAGSSGPGEGVSKKEPDPSNTGARKVWDAEGTGNPAGRVANPGDAEGQPVPYDIETQADAVGAQTERDTSANKGKL